MYAYLMAVSASGTQRQDRDFYRGVPATGKAVCVADTSPPKAPIHCGELKLEYPRVRHGARGASSCASGRSRVSRAPRETWGDFWQICGKCVK